MATTVGQHSVSAFATPVNGGPLDANIVRGNDNTIRTAYVSHDADTGIHVQSSTLATRPAAGTAGRKWITEDSGVYTLWFDDGTNWHPVSSENVALTVLAKTALTKGDVVKVTGWNNGQDLPEVEKVASASDVAFAIMTADATINTMGYATNTGIVQDLNTNAFNAGDILYPNSSGGFTATKPTSGSYQVAAYVLRKGTTNGVIFVEFSGPRIVEASANTASTIVLRDASGNFSAGTITAGALTASGAVSAGSVTSTGLVTFASLKGTGATTVTNILDEDNMASDSATALATQQSIKAYVDAKVATVDTLAEVLANGNTTGATNLIVTAGQKITTDTIDETTSAAGVTIDSVLLKDNEVKATGIKVTNLKANDGTAAGSIADSTGKITITAAPILSALTASQAVFTDSSKGLVSNAITGTGNVVMSAAPTLTGTITAADLSMSGTLTLGSDVALSRGAANRLDLATGDSLNVVSGSYKIANTDVLTSTTLGSGVTASSLTSVGTLSSLTVSGTSSLNGAVTINDAGADVDFRVEGDTDVNLIFGDASTDRVGIGTASPSEKLHVEQSAVTGALVKSTGANAAYIEASGNNATVRARLQSSLSDAWAGTLTNHPFFFQTNNTERARITSGGYFKASSDGTYIGSTASYHELSATDTATSVAQIRARTTSYTGSVITVSCTTTTTDSTYNLARFHNTAGTGECFIRDSGNLANTNGTYGTISDAKLKQDIIDAPSQWDDLKAVRFRKYRFKKDVEQNGEAAPYLLGVVAQELQAVSPGLVESSPDVEEVEVTDEDGNITIEMRPTGTETLSVKSSILLMKAAVALQEAMARIEALEARLEALEA